MDTTILYYTENRLREPLFSFCQRMLEKAANGRPIVSISHKPINLGINICIGVHKPSWLMLYKQLFYGVRLAKTKYVATAEHDCLYTDEHFSFKPPKDDTFYYNENNRLVQYAQDKHEELKGMYSSYWKQRLALSQMICNRELLVEMLGARLDLLDRGRKDIVKSLVFAGEFGLSDMRVKESRHKKIMQARKWAESGRPVYLKNLIKDHLDKEKYDVFKTEIPNLDIRHDSNFTGPKRGKRRTFNDPHWGKFEDLLNSV